MAQIRKFQPGGKLTISGKDYTIEQINEYMNSGAFDAQERAALANTISSIANGASRTFDRNANSISGEGVTDDFVDFYGGGNKGERRAEKNKGRSINWSNRQARRNSDHHIVNSALEKLGGIEDYYNPNKKSKDSKDGKNTDNVLRKGSGFFKYDNESGEYLDNAENFGYMDLVTRGFNYLKGNRDDWDTSAFSESELNWLHDWYNKNVGYEFGLQERIKSGQLNNTDRNLLSVFGLSQNQIEDLEQKQQKRFQTAKYDYSKFRPYFDVNDKGQLIARTIDGKSVFSPFGGNGNYWFNEQFVKNNPQYSFLKDHFLINGILYHQSLASDPNSDLYKYLHQPNGFYDLNKKGDWVGANGLIRQYWDGQNHTNYALASESPVTSDYFRNNPGIRWASVTGAYDVDLNPGEQLLEVYDPSEQTDILDNIKTKLIVLDSEGNYLRTIDDTHPRNLTGNKPQGLTGRQVIRQPGSIYDGMEKYDIKDTGMSFYWDPTTSRLIYDGDILFASNTEGKAYTFPKEIAKILMSNPNFMDNLATSKLLPDFQRTLGSTVNSGFRDWFRWAGTDDMSLENWKELGFNDDDAQMLEDYFEKMDNNKYYGSMASRRNQRLVDSYNPVSVQKLGGKINYLKRLQPGGTIGTTESKGFTEMKTSKPVPNYNNFANIGEDKFTAADWTDLGGLVLDLAGTGLGFSGVPYASGIVGALGSTAGFAADITRDGLDWGDVGNYALNLGLDAVSLIPFAGTAGQSVKAVGKIRKAAKVIGKFLSNPWVVRSLAGMGIGSAVKTSAEKIINGESWTIRDIKNVANGLSGIMALRKTGWVGGGVKKQDVGEINVKIKDKDIKVKLEEADLKRIAEASENDTDKVLREIIKEKHPKIGRSKTKTSDIDFSPAKIEEKLGLKFWKGKQPTGEYDFQLKTETVAPEFTKEGLSKGGNQLQDRFNHYLRTGEWKTLDDAGNVIDATDQLRDALNAKRPDQNGRKLLREASFVLPNVWSYSEQEPRLQPGFVAAPVVDPYANHFKEGGKIQFAKNGKKITKHKFTSIMPPPELIIPKMEYKPKYDPINTDYFSVKSETPSYLSTESVNPKYQKMLSTPIEQWNSFLTPQVKDVENMKDTEGMGSVKSTKEPKLANPQQTGAILSNVGQIVGEAALTAGGINKQVGRAAKVRDVVKGIPNINNPEYDESFNDSGKKLAYDLAAQEAENQASYDVTSDSYRNRLFRKQAAAEARLNRLQGRLAQSQDYSAFRQRNLERKTAYAAQRVANLNEKIKRDAQADVAHQMELGKADALFTDMGKKAIGDLTGIYNKSKLAGLQSDYTQKTRNYQDWYDIEKAKYNAGVKAGTINNVNYPNFDKYIAGNKSLLDEQRRRFDEISGIKMNAAMYQYKKKGGKIRSTEDQIKIDTEKAKHKAIAQLSKQAFEILKMALK